MARRKRRSFTPEKKMAILKLHLLDGLPVSEFCDEYDTQPNQFYNWQKKFIENEAAGFTRQLGP